MSASRQHAMHFSCRLHHQSVLARSRAPSYRVVSLSFSVPARQSIPVPRSRSTSLESAPVLFAALSILARSSFPSRLHRVHPSPKITKYRFLEIKLQPARKSVTRPRLCVFFFPAARRIGRVAVQAEKFRSIRSHRNIYNIQSDRTAATDTPVSRNRPARKCLSRSLPRSPLAQKACWPSIASLGFSPSERHTSSLSKIHQTRVRRCEESRRREEATAPL